MRVFVSMLVFSGVLAVVPAFSQARSVTNSDLEKYRQKRLQAEKDYNENYAKMGFPSPEELQKQLDKNKSEREALAARLTQERIERERIAAEQEAQRQATTPAVTIVNGGGYNDWYPNYYWGRYYYRRNFRGGFGPRLYAAPISVGNGIPIIDYHYGNPLIQGPGPMGGRGRR